LRSTWHPEAARLAIPGTEEVHGGVRHQLESVRYELEDFIDAGEYVVTPFANRVSGRDGIEVLAHGTWLWTIRGGAIVRVCLYQERQEAAGLRE
jgi:ketosteroid isomerase-like protein